MSVSGTDFVINLTGSGNNTIIPAPVAPRFIRVLHYHLSASAAVTVKLLSDSEVKDVCYATTVAGGGIATPEYADGVFNCNPGEALIINLSTSANVGGAGKYVIKG